MDARVRYSQLSIKTALIKLLKNDVLDDISVTDICKEAKVNRATFYKYFKSPYDVLAKVEDDHIAEIKRKLDYADANGLKDVFDVAVKYMQSDADFFSVVVSGHGNTQFRSKIIDACKPYNIDIIKEKFPEITETQREFLYHFLAEGIIGMILSYEHETEHKYSLDDYVMFTLDFIDKFNTIGSKYYNK